MLTAKRGNAVEYLCIIVLLVWLVWRTRSTKARYYAFASLAEQLNEIEAMLARVSVKEIEEKRKLAEQAFIAKYEQATWLYRSRRPKL